MRDNKNVKFAIVLQSFAPLFLLLVIKHYCLDPISLFGALFSGKFSEVHKILQSDKIDDIVILIVSMLWMIITVSISFAFKGFQESGFTSAGENIIIEESPNDSGAAFLVTYALPLLLDGISPFKDIVFLMVLLIMIIFLFCKSNSFYQNPVLTAMNYRVFTFKFLNPASDVHQPDRVYIGITKNTPISEDVVIKRKHISDGVFLIYNE